MSTRNTTPPVVIHDPKLGRWLTFTSPVRIVTATRLAEVLPALREIEAAVERQNLHAAGFLSYEAAPAFDAALPVRPDPSGFPLLWFGLFPPPAESVNLPAPVAAPQPELVWTPGLTRERYTEAVTRLRDYLHAGETYQVNFTFRLTAPFHGSPWATFHQLVAAQGPHYSAFVDTGAFALASASPELFFRLDGERLTSRPMKGTAPRGTTLADDEHQAASLRASPKNQAENVMIVDMIRNDMGRVARSGTVVAEPLFEVERYPTVWQMVSTVTAQTSASFSEIMTALFPCASITGAPKPHTMAIIAREETSPRRIYTGSIGYLAPGRRAQFNVAIRTLLADRTAGLAEYGVGGGIVWDSTPGDEYEECLVKAKILAFTPPEFSLLETLLWTPEAGVFLLERHLKRLAESAVYLGYGVDLAAIRELLEQQGARFAMEAQDRPFSPSGGTRPPGRPNDTGPRARRIRLLVARDGMVTIEAFPFDPVKAAQPARVRLASTPVDPGDRFLYHKTTNRRVYEQAAAAAPDCDDVLLWNCAGELTESTVANLVVELDGKLLTPPVSSGLLPGTYRAELLAKGEIEEGVIRKEDIACCRAMFLVNSLRRQRAAVLVP